MKSIVYYSAFFSAVLLSTSVFANDVSCVFEEDQVKVCESYDTGIAEAAAFFEWACADLSGVIVDQCPSTNCSFKCEINNLSAPTDGALNSIFIYTYGDSVTLEEATQSCTLEYGGQIFSSCGLD